MGFSKESAFSPKNRPVISILTSQHRSFTRNRGFHQQKSEDLLVVFRLPVTHGDFTKRNGGFHQHGDGDVHLARTRENGEFTPPGRNISLKGGESLC